MRLGIVELEHKIANKLIQESTQPGGIYFESQA